MQPKLFLIYFFIQKINLINVEEKTEIKQKCINFCAEGKSGNFTAANNDLTT